MNLNLKLFNVPEQEGPQNYTVKGKQLVCQHCGNDTFVLKYHAMHWVGEMLNKAVPCFVCESCTHMHFFEGGQGSGE